MTHPVRLATPVIGGPHWMGGWNYMINMARAISAHAPDAMNLVIAAGATQRDHPDLMMLDALPGIDVIHDPAFDPANKSRRLALAIGTGLDGRALSLFAAHGVDVVFEPANFFGWRFPLPTIAWMPDFQHRRLPHLFTRPGWWRREIGFRAQIASNRTIMLSSRDAEEDCQSFYAASRGRTRVVPFAVTTPDTLSLADAYARVDALGLPRHFFFMPNQLWNHKNHAIAIEAARLLKQQGVDAMIIATGHGDDPRTPDLRETLMARVADNVLDSHFRFTGALRYADVQALCLTAAAIINPSRFEGWSTAVEEAKAIGTPLLLSDLRVHREQAAHVAKFFDPDDAATLADHIKHTPPRDAAAIEAARSIAVESYAVDQRNFAMRLASLVSAVAGGR
ncbi:glycosyltransferase [Sphingomonas sp.]|uniref:glycosyltransferase n=1 Tax=Sphingomonas sp. TaxID=28214 RepID=UPI001E01DB39|nr:glycosyltransferase [Sphingomonas sp.]MBX9795999.1 glycosyltransferase [Sphingomonas sp.]